MIDIGGDNLLGDSLREEENSNRPGGGHTVISQVTVAKKHHVSIHLLGKASKKTIESVIMIIAGGDGGDPRVVIILP